MSSIVRSVVSRISVSLPEALLRQLDHMVMERGFESRSQAIAEMINQQLLEHKQEMGEDIMAGTITLVYDHSTPGLQQQLAVLQHEHLSEVISSLRAKIVFLRLPGATGQGVCARELLTRIGRAWQIPPSALDARDILPPNALLGAESLDRRPVGQV